MKKCILPLLFIPFVIPSCNKNLTDMPKSPFNDSYIRIGMKGEYNENLTPLEASNYAALKSAIDNYNDDYKAATKVVRKEETRDLKYAYFGNEVGLVSRCSMLSRTDTESRYVKSKNYVTTKEAISNQQNQTANAGIIKTDSKTVDYIYDDNYLHGTDLETKYGVRTSVKNNDEPEVVTQKTPETTDYDETKFNLQPYINDIKENFKPGTVREKEYNFGILRDTNSAVYGKCFIEGEERYLIKEGYSVFAPYTTTVGRTYKAVDNYFYEGLLDEFTNPSGESDFRFTNFRFYHEVLILSKAYDDGVPVIYLEKPVVVWYDEIKYEISYDSLGDYTGTIPEPTNE